MHWTDEQIKRAWDDFRVFVFIVWRSIGLPQPTPIQLDMAKYLQFPPKDRFIIMGFRGVAKSFLTCAYVVWRLWKNPQSKIMIVSASKDRADANANFIKKIIFTLPFLAELKPKKGQRDTQNLFDVGGAVPDIQPSVKSVGITGQLTGTRAHILIADDVEVPNNSSTQMQRDKLNEAVKEFEAILKPDEQCQIIYLGTPQNEGSLYNELQNRGYKTIIWPVLYPESQAEREFYGDRLSPLIASKYDENPLKWRGQPTDTERFNMEEIEKRRLSYGRAGFALQFMLNTNLSDQEKYPLKVQDFIVTSLELEQSSLKWSWASDTHHKLIDLPCVALKGDYFCAPLSRSSETAPYTGTVMAIDPSGKGKDLTAYAIIKFLNGYLFLMDIGGYRDGYSEATLKTLANKAKFFGVNDIVYEANYGDGMFGQLLKPVLNSIHPCAVQEVKHSKQKEMRIIDTLEPVLMRHKLIVNQQIILDDFEVYTKEPAHSFIYQLTRLSREKGSLVHDDKLDAVCMAVAFWLDVMGRDSQLGMDEFSAEQWEQWLDPDMGILYVPEKPGENQQIPKSLNMVDTFFKF